MGAKCSRENVECNEKNSADKNTDAFKTADACACFSGKNVLGKQESKTKAKWEEENIIFLSVIGGVSIIAVILVHVLTAAPTYRGPGRYGYN